jgi:hypothetical protein
MPDAPFATSAHDFVRCQTHSQSLPFPNKRRECPLVPWNTEISAAIRSDRIQARILSASAAQHFPARRCSAVWARRERRRNNHPRPPMANSDGCRRPNRHLRSVGSSISHRSFLEPLISGGLDLPRRLDINVGQAGSDPGPYALKTAFAWSSRCSCRDAPTAGLTWESERPMPIWPAYGDAYCFRIQQIAGLFQTPESRQDASRRRSRSAASPGLRITGHQRYHAPLA